MNDTWQNNAYGAADGRLQAGGGTAGHWSAEVEELAAAAVAFPSRPAAAPVRSAITPPAQRSSGRASDGAEPLRLVQVYLTPVIDEFLRQARSMAIMQGLDVSASAVVRHAIEQLMAAAGPAEIVELLGSPKGQGYRKRGRPRRLKHPLRANLYMHNSEKVSYVILA